MSWADYAHGQEYHDGHWAVDLDTPFHTPITNVLPGTVVKADYAIWNGKRGGGEVFIKPDDASQSQYYYYHLDHLNVSPGQHVGANQLLGLSGGENPGYPGAEHPTDAMWSTGLHTHFGRWTGWNSGRPYGPPPYDLLAMAQGKDVPLLSSITNGSTSTGVPGVNISKDFWQQIAVGSAGIVLFIIGGAILVGSLKEQAVSSVGKGLFGK